MPVVHEIIMFDQCKCSYSAQFSSLVIFQEKHMRQLHVVTLVVLLVSGNVHAQSEQPPNATETPTAPELPNGNAAARLCSEDSENLPCWVELDNPPGCH